jgi:hypothetical protein
MVLPNGIIAGVNKAGTTAVFHSLAQQENVAVSNVKETHFFGALRRGDPLPDLTEYAALFPRETDAAAVVEATPDYFYGGERIARGIDAALPGVRIVVILREPGARAYSWWRFSRSRLWIPSDISFREYLEKCTEIEDPETQRGVVGWRGLSGGLYSRYLPAWQETFGPRLLTLFYDDLRCDFEGSMQRICAHFGVEWSPDTQPSQEHNYRRQQCSAATRGVVREPLLRATVAQVPAAEVGAAQWLLQRERSDGPGGHDGGGPPVAGGLLLRGDRPTPRADGRAGEPPGVARGPASDRRGRRRRRAGTDRLSSSPSPLTARG